MLLWRVFVVPDKGAPPGPDRLVRGQQRRQHGAVTNGRRERGRRELERQAPQSASYPGMPF